MRFYQKCPVCEGRGVVPAGFYNPYPEYSLTGAAPEICRACNSLGYIEAPFSHESAEDGSIIYYQEFDSESYSMS